MSQPNRISSFGTILVSEGISESDYSRLQALGIELEQLYDQSLERAKRIDDDPEYTSQGKTRKKQVLTEQISESLGKYDRIIHQEMEMIGNQQSWALELRKLKEGMHSSTQPKADPVLAFLEQQEIRNYLRSIQEPMQIESIVRTQAERGNFSFLDAVKAAPEGAEKFLLPKSMELLESKRLESLNPQATRRIQEIQRSQRTLSNMVNSLKAALRKQDLFSEPEQPIKFLQTG